MLLLVTAVLAADLSGLALEASTSQRQLLVGEPLKVTLRWKAVKAVDDVAIENPAFLFQSLLLSVNNGAGTRLYREYPHQIVEKVLVTRPLRKGAEEVVGHVFFRGAYLDRPGGDAQDSLLFPTKGEYSVTVLYVHDGGISDVVSNSLRLTVSDPGPSGREILEALRTDPRLVSANGSAESQALVGNLMEKHPGSPYLRFARLERLQQRASALESHQDPDTGESFYHLGKEARGEFSRHQYRRLAEDILSEQHWGPFEEEALALASHYALAAGDTELSGRVKKDLFEKHPRSATVKRMKDADAQPVIEADEPDVKPTPKPKQ